MIDTPIVFFFNTYGALVLFVLVVLGLLLGKKKKKQALKVVLISLLTYVICLVLKNLFDSTRPFVTNGYPPLANPFVNGSFPSFHTALAFAVATGVALEERRLGILIFVLAALIGFGRVAANVHYPVDVAFGAVLGTLIALFVGKLAF